jgi:NAD(P)-dependent dehydrogenase (short-subunit alcohol dehydrogenase family)
VRGGAIANSADTGSVRGRRLVVVGASAGIGRAFATRAVRAGAEVVLAGRRGERLDEVVAQAAGGHPVVADIADADACASLIASAVDVLGAIDALVVCSGASGFGLLRDVVQDDWRSVFDINVIGPSLVTAAALPHLVSGAFVGYLSSESVGRPRHGLVPYSASKAALEETIRGWRVEHPEVRFCCLCIGSTLGTEFGRDFDPELAVSLFRSWIAHGHMAATMMQVEDVGEAVLDVVSSALAHPGIDLQAVTLRPPGGLIEGGVESMMGNLAENRSPRQS